MYAMIIRLNENLLVYMIKTGQMFKSAFINPGSNIGFKV